MRLGGGRSPEPGARCYAMRIFLLLSISRIKNENPYSHLRVLLLVPLAAHFHRSDQDSLYDSCATRNHDVPDECRGVIDIGCYDLNVVRIARIGRKLGFVYPAY